MKIQHQISQRIAILRCIMIFGVVLLHTPNHLEVNELDFSNTFYLIRAFFQDGVFRATVPVLSLISGYFLFGSNLDQAPLKLYKKKFETLVVPFFFFNVMFAAVIYLLEKMTGLMVWHDMTKMNEVDLLNAFFSITSSPIDYPLYFLRDMIVVVLLAPAMGYLLRRAPLTGGIFLTFFFMGNFDGYLVLRFTIPVMMYIGGAAAIYQWNLTALDRLAKPATVIFLVACTCIIAFRVTNRSYFTLAAPFLVWPAASLLINTSVGQLAQKASKYSFFVFCAHAPVLFAGYVVYQRYGKGVSEWVFWLTDPVVTIGFLIVVDHVTMKLMPQTFSLLTGGRARKTNTAPVAIPDVPEDISVLA